MTTTPVMLAVVAHPDDETFGLGSLLLHARASGVETAVVCATRGEAGESADGTAPADLGAVRERETRASARRLGVSRVEFLDLRDSGMSGPAGPETLFGASPSAVADEIRASIELIEPTIVVSLDGCDGHRDHLRIGQTTLAAIEESSWPVDRVYLHGISQALLRRWVAHMAAQEPEREHLQIEVPGTPDEAITTTVDTTKFFESRLEAMRLHASQHSPFDGLPDDLRRAFLTTETLQRIRPPWPGGAREETYLPEPAG